MLSEDATPIQRDATGVQPGGDGRRARRERGRSAVLDAAKSFFDEGEARPTAEALAGRAGVSPASLYRYFDRLDQLPHLVFRAQVDAVAPLLRIDVDGRSLDERVRAFVGSRVDVYEQVQGIARMGRARAIDHADVAAALAEARTGWRRQVRVVFATELSGRSRHEVRDLTAMVDTVASFESWDLLVSVHGLPRRSIETQWRETLHRLLAS